MSEIGQPLAASIILAIGLAIFYFRFHLRALYGLIEVVLGIIIGTAKVSENLEKLESSSFYIAMLTASIYLVVRGFDNMHQGSKNPNDLLMKKLKKHNNQYTNTETTKQHFSAFGF
ncbi:hypothetical protein SYJ56_04540 [Algoriphagus sp. D3-2-R+10]|uniref:hypothetical protein n=1 Tax=Algoriphagus aurantiacus TaxID=3103948 RepID=UPI002B393347|nr:hypothetical protein [Algoriphagus sp. D3-2-R+10]MEB2774560.1 hypothetical protein [Algoriphagus sp. D3-2-R+10]